MRAVTRAAWKSRWAPPGRPLNTHAIGERIKDGERPTGPTDRLARRISAAVAFARRLVSFQAPRRQSAKVRAGSPWQKPQAVNITARRVWLVLVICVSPFV